MSAHDHRAGDPDLSHWTEDVTLIEDNLEIVQLSAARVRAVEETGAVIARQLNGPLTALLLYMNEIKQHSHQLTQASGNRFYLQQVVENALQQTERVCAMVKQISDPVALSAANPRPEREGHARNGGRTSGVMLAAQSREKPLTKREREVLGLISEGCSNKQGALRMNISPRTFESHRAEAMRKLGARNTADLVRKALLQLA